MGAFLSQPWLGILAKLGGSRCGGIVHSGKARPIWEAAHFWSIGQFGICSSLDVSNHTRGGCKEKGIKDNECEHVFYPPSISSQPWLPHFHTQRMKIYTHLFFCCFFLNLHCSRCGSGRALLFLRLLLTWFWCHCRDCSFNFFYEWRTLSFLFPLWSFRRCGIGCHISRGVVCLQQRSNGIRRLFKEPLLILSDGVDVLQIVPITEGRRI